MWNTCTFSCEEPHVLLDFNQTWILSTRLRHESPQYINDHENTSSGSRADTRGQTNKQTNKHDEANMRFWRLKQTRLKLHTWMESQGSLSCPQELDIGPYNEPD